MLFNDEFISYDAPLNIVHCRECAALPIHSPTDVEAVANREHTLRELLPAEMRRAVDRG